MHTYANYKLIVIDSSKQHALDADPKSMQQINLTGNLERARNTTIFFITKKSKKLSYISHKEL